MNKENILVILIAIYSEVEDLFPFNLTITELQNHPISKFEIKVESVFDNGDSHWFGLDANYGLADSPVDECKAGETIKISSDMVKQHYETLMKLGWISVEE